MHRHVHRSNPRRRAFVGLLCAGLALPWPVDAAEPSPPQAAEMAGYLLVPHERVEPSFDAGFSMYVAAWPLLEHYPGQDFQSGLFGTWMFAQHGDRKPEKAYSDIEGGLGWWRDTRFATETPKFIMGGVALEFVEWANGPGAGKGRDWDRPAGHYAIAQVSPWVLWPPDGLNLRQGTSGELVGYGYLPLPLVPPKDSTGGAAVPTGGQCWTLFLNTGNFKGPLTFFLPSFWSKPTIDRPDLAGMFLDARPSDPNKAVQMETQHVPAFIAGDATGTRYARIAPTRFPGSPSGAAPLVHRITAYDRSALWDGVAAWFEGGPAVSGAIDPRGSREHTFEDRGGATWEIYPLGAPREERVPLAWDSIARPVALDPTTFGYRWMEGAVADEDAGGLVTVPEYFRLEADDAGRRRWNVVAAADVPAETGLREVDFPRRRGEERGPYVTPDDPGSCWNTPGPVSGPHEARLGDESVVTYCWYRFADQPALLNADLSPAEREALQRRVEMLHRTWTRQREYLPAPAIGTLADLDPALVVEPPPGLEAGYVPIVTRQAIDD